MTRGLTFVSLCRQINISHRAVVKCCYDTDTWKTNLSCETTGRIGKRLVEMFRLTNPLNHRVYSAQRLRSRQVVEQCCSPDNRKRRVCFSETCSPLHTEPGPQHKQKRPRVHDRSSTELKWKTTYSSEQATGSGDSKLWGETSFL